MEATGKKPSADKLHEWLEANAAKMEAPQPTFDEVRKHAKCLRTKESIREYFKEYRATKEEKNKGKNTGNGRKKEKEKEKEKKEEGVTSLRQKITMEMLPQVFERGQVMIVPLGGLTKDDLKRITDVIVARHTSSQKKEEIAKEEIAKEEMGEEEMGEDLDREFMEFCAEVVHDLVH